MATTPSQSYRQAPRLRAFVVAIVGFLLLLLGAFFWQNFVSFSPTIKSLAVVAPASKTVTALLPQGPQHVTLTYTEGSQSAPTTKVLLSGYVDFSGVDPAGCAMLLTGTADSRATSTGPYTSHSAFIIHKAPGQEAFSLFTRASGQYQTFPINVYQPFDYPLRARIAIAAPSFSSLHTGELCGFDQMARYAIATPTGAIVWNPTKFAAVENYYTESFYRPFVAASTVNGESKNSTYNSLLATLKPPDVTGLFNSWPATLTKNGSTIVYSQKGQATVTITFTPTAAQTVPTIPQKTYLQEAVAFAKSGQPVGLTPPKYVP